MEICDLLWLAFFTHTIPLRLIQVVAHKKCFSFSNFRLFPPPPILEGISGQIFLMKWLANPPHSVAEHSQTLIGNVWFLAFLLTIHVVLRKSWQCTTYSFKSRMISRKQNNTFRKILNLKSWSELDSGKFT